MHFRSIRWVRPPARASTAPKVACGVQAATTRQLRSQSTTSCRRTTGKRLHGRSCSTVESQGSKTLLVDIPQGDESRPFLYLCQGCEACRHRKAKSLAQGLSTVCIESGAVARVLDFGDDGESLLHAVRVGNRITPMRRVGKVSHLPTVAQSIQFVIFDH